MKRITPEQWQSISAYLDQAIELEEAERAKWLAAIAQNDPAAAQLLSRVLADREHEQFSQFLAGPTPIPLDYIRPIWTSTRGAPARRQLSDPSPQLYR